MSAQIEIVNHPETAITLESGLLQFAQKDILARAYFDIIYPADRRNLLLLTQYYDVEDKLLQARIYTSGPILARGILQPRQIETYQNYYLEPGESAIIFRPTLHNNDLTPFLTVRKIKE
jgi:hypothetical protein